VDVWTPTKVYPYHTLVPSYKYLSAHPQRWKALYYLSNTRWYEKITNLHSTLTCYDKIKQQLEEYDPDVVVSVHPTMNYLPEKIIREISKARNKYVPFFTVVTDFGSGHCTWFQGTVDKMYVASERIKTLAKRRGAKVKDEHLVMTGLPIRDDFARLAEKMNGRTTQEGKAFRKEVKAQLGLDPEKRMILVMGGGEGVGSLGIIAEQLYLKLRSEGVDATICAVCGRNDKTRMELETKDWDAAYAKVDPFQKSRTNRRRFRLFKILGQKLHHKKIKGHGKGYMDSRMTPNTDVISSTSRRQGKVNVVGLGFVSNMADYMVASDVLVSKAGPGTIAEAASVGLPVMITR
jgi:1,2-diacylglycerol 3-beta-galactosyltransferase